MTLASAPVKILFGEDIVETILIFLSLCSLHTLSVSAKLTQTHSDGETLVCKKDTDPWLDYALNKSLENKSLNVNNVSGILCGPSGYIFVCSFDHQSWADE